MTAALDGRKTTSVFTMLLLVAASAKMACAGGVNREKFSGVSRGVDDLSLQI